MSDVATLYVRNVPADVYAESQAGSNESAQPGGRASAGSTRSSRRARRGDSPVRTPSSPFRPSVSTATPGSRVVFDASAALRAAVDRNEEALNWFAAAERGEVDASWPELALIEIAHGLLRLL